MNLRTAYIGFLSVATVFYACWHLLPGPDLGVATVSARVEVPGYVRADFGGWLPGTRDTVMKSQTIDGILYDPYARAPAGNRVEVDHVFPLSAAWDLGASMWTKDKKLAFANDPLNLVATASALNQTKSDSLPADWLPPADRCDYSRRLAAVARKYELPLPARDYETMRHQCQFDFISWRR
ncbi:HNH endonuclease family protein [Corynebacterium sp. HMSC05E07]|uniref:HNH endonuclease family protein n=1 Tax=Corynebacterium sp. HMSC05E07 TaxID=1581117 RepID=UPI0008A15AA7|nr:HNH endonuclease family protein [Corynebacterium sp. HMSC05E07]OFT61423.1 hypothetical protein HMPREF3149_05830 [Corynebacterium sp. HMSC05E07]